MEIQKNIQKQEAEIKEKTENIKKLSKNRMYKDLYINNIKIYEKYGNTYFTAEIENKSENKFKQKDIVINFLDEEEKSIVKFGYHIDDIKSGEKIEIKIISNQELTKAQNFKIEE